MSINIKQKVLCSFNTNQWCLRSPNYVCAIRKVRLLHDIEFDFVGLHQRGKSNEDVDAITFQECLTEKMPQGLTKSFPNLKFLEFSRSNLGFIESADLKEYANVTDLYLQRNKIVFLPKDLFANTPRLEVIWLHNNNIELIHPNVFDDLQHLQNLWLSESHFFSTFPQHPGNTGLVDIKSELRQRFAQSRWKNVFKEKDTDMYNDLQHAMENENLKDFTVKVGEKEFKAHKFVIAARSPVLAEIIENNKDAECLNLTDVTSEIFRKVFHFIYTNELPKVDATSLIQIIEASKKLNIEKLTNIATQKLSTLINPQNALQILQLSNKHGMMDLKQKSFGVIRKFLQSDKIDESLASQPEKLKDLIKMKMKIKNMETEFNAMLM
jgi:Leucine-rich repeat (LRR) protein